jgi:methylated-DNA-[protein]-cysteine S-methyltransferase
MSLIQDPPYRIFYQSPVGWLRIDTTETHLLRVWFCDRREAEDRPGALAQKTRRQLEEYFDHRRTDFNLPTDPQGSAFQQKVWKALLRIPLGKTISYLELSRWIGDEKAVRAVGHANGQNPIPIIIPCHRVIGSNGSLTGYGGGIWRKKWLLTHEGILRQLELDFD